MIDPKELLGALARGWCHPKNSGKEMDPDLAISIAAEVNALLPSEAVELVPEGMVLVPRKQIMGNLNDLEIGDYVEVRYKDGSGKVKGTITKLWVSPHAQAQVNNGWCFHPGDEITIHQRPSPTGDEQP
jgi:hypothetical protein